MSFFCGGTCIPNWDSQYDPYVYWYDLKRLRTTWSYNSVQFAHPCQWQAVIKFDPVLLSGTSSIEWFPRSHHTVLAACSCLEFMTYATNFGCNAGDTRRKKYSRFLFRGKIASCCPSVLWFITSNALANVDIHRIEHIIKLGLWCNFLELFSWCADIISYNVFR